MEQNIAITKLRLLLNEMQKCDCSVYNFKFKDKYREHKSLVVEDLTESGILVLA